MSGASLSGDFIPSDQNVFLINNFFVALTKSHYFVHFITHDLCPTAITNKVNGRNLGSKIRSQR